MPNKLTTQTYLAAEEFGKLVAPIRGLPVSHVWRGYGSAIFLEIGELTTNKRPGIKSDEFRRNPNGQYGVMIEWSWRVEKARSIYFGSWNTTKIIDSRLASLRGRLVEEIDVEGRLPELVVKLSGGLWVHSFATTEGQTEWCLFLDRKRPRSEWLKSERGKLIKECTTSNSHHSL